MICHPLLVPELPSDELLLRGMLAGFTMFEATHSGQAGVSSVQKRGCRCKTESILLLMTGKAGPLELTELSRAQEVVAKLKDGRLIE